MPSLTYPLNSFVSLENSEHFLDCITGKLLGAQPLSLKLSESLPSFANLHQQLYEVMKENFTNAASVRCYRKHKLVSSSELLLQEIFNCPDILSAAKDFEITINLNDLQGKIGFLGEIAAAFSNSLGAELTVNAFISPPHQSSTPVHYDYDDILIYQVAGSKCWDCFDYIDSPSFTNDGYQLDLALLGKPHLSTSLTSESAIWLPRGTPHRAYTSGSMSIHFGFQIKKFLARDIATLIFKEKFEVSLQSNDSPILINEYLPRLASDLKNTAAKLGEINDVATLEYFQKFQLIQAARYKRLEPRAEINDINFFRKSLGSLFFWEVYADTLTISYSTELRNADEIDITLFSPSKIQLPAMVSVLLELIDKSPEGFSRQDVEAVYDAESSNILLSLLTENGIIDAIVA
jgi:hypothetical protein